MTHDLNPSQRDAVKTLRGPLLVLAGAGSGKTRVVTYRIAELIRTGTRPERILAVTFTKKAAGEMQSRVADLLGRRPKGEKPFISTFHSLCVQVLRRHITKMGYPQAFTIYDRADQEMTARGVLREIRAADAGLRPGDLLAIISRWKTAALDPSSASASASTDREHLAAVGYRRYQRALQAAGAVDFDDLLLLTETLFGKSAEVRRDEARRFDHILVDEYQDTNGAQYRIIKALAGDHRNLCVVGDDDQSIYAWRGADVHHILRFQRDWPGAKVVRLEDNYRSTGPILEFANRLIRFNHHRHDKALRTPRSGPPPLIKGLEDELAESRFVAGEIRTQLDSHLACARDFAVLLRTNEQSRQYETELRRTSVPYVMFGGTSFFDRKEVRDMLAYLRLLVHSRDEASLRRIINVPARGISQATVEKLSRKALERGTPLWELLKAASSERQVAPATVESIAHFVQLVEQYRARLSRPSLRDRGSPSSVGVPLKTLLENLVKEIRYQEDLARQYPNPNERDARWNSVVQVFQALEEYEQGAKAPSLRGFLDDVTLDPRDDRGDKEQKLKRDAVALMTLHSAKGLEFSQVFLVGMEEGLLPHQKSLSDFSDTAIDEERRLCYVGITRAQDKLTLTWSKTRIKWGKPRPTKPSRFLYEMTGHGDHPQAVQIRAVQSGNGRPRAQAARAT